MTEFIVPARHIGADGNFVCACIAGLDRTTYDHIDLSIDGENFIEAQIDPNNPTRTLPVAFLVKSAGLVFEVTGRAISNGIAVELKTKMTSITTQNNNDVSHEKVKYSGSVGASPPASIIE